MKRFYFSLHGAIHSNKQCLGTVRTDIFKWVLPVSVVLRHPYKQGPIGLVKWCLHIVAFEQATQHIFGVSLTPWIVKNHVISCPLQPNMFFVHRSANFFFFLVIVQWPIHHTNLNFIIIMIRWTLSYSKRHDDLEQFWKENPVELFWHSEEFSTFSLKTWPLTDESKRCSPFFILEFVRLSI